MENNTNILGCYASYPTLMYGATEVEQTFAKEQGDLFRSYIWGEKGIDKSLKNLNNFDYGNDLKLALLQFHIKPIPYELPYLKEIENYRRKEQSIGMCIIITDENFFNKSEEGRYRFLKEAIMQKMDLLAEVVKKKKLDTNMEQLKADLEKILQ